MLDGKITIFISCSEQYRQRVGHAFRDLIQNLGFGAVILSEAPKLENAWTTEEKLVGYLERSDALVVLCTPDDQRADKTWAVRPNIIDELGRARTMKHLRDRIAVFKSKQVTLPSNVAPVYEQLDTNELDSALKALIRQLEAWKLAEATTAALEPKDADEARELLEMTESLISVVRQLDRGEDPFLDALEDPLGTSSEDYFMYQIDELAEYKVGADVKAAVHAKKWDEALSRLREIRDELRRRI